MPAHEYLTADQVKRLVFSCSTETEKMLIQLGLVIGCRVSEIVSIRISDIGDRRIQIWDEKKDRYRVVVIDSATDDMIEAYVLDGMIEQTGRKDQRRLFPFCSRTANNILKRVCARAEIAPDLAHWHILRHTYVVQSLEMGVPLNHIVEQTGDSPITLLRVYGRPNIEDRQRMIEGKAYWR